MQSDALVLHARQRNRDEPTPNGIRLAVIAVRRFATAVARNRARRVVREASRVLLEDVCGPWDVALMVRAEALEQPYQERLAALADLFRRVGVVPGHGAAVQ